ncbi:MAG: aspartate racemase [Firmicutes bacterium GWF2_51_9]|nr:MAG: aspartate racemase [Firmicutes bacterium GWF2_51_9]OGS57378.1 MAG: aspartate racemase [Firmicutes bacterium GWE2_51_13]HAM63818.1 aspartate racemase [Erysipelotrichaceae bacterium]HBZ41494.1 aspartate racemase [Erysipelotrichaceae bacterium]
MKTIGLIGGMSWESTVPYYTILNEEVKKALGGYHSAKILLYSVDFDEIEKDQVAGNWEHMGETLGNIARTLQDAGADAIVLCTNTMHKVAPQIESKISVPFLHIADATAEAIQEKGMKRVALLGTRYTMSEGFYRDRLTCNGLEVQVPNEQEQSTIHRVIFEELVLGILRDESRNELLAIIDRLANDGAQCIILGCTEIGMLVKQEDTDVMLFDTVEMHAKKAARFMLDNEKKA